MKNFLNLTWVKIVSWIMIVIGVIVQLLNGVSVVEINEVIEMIFTIVQVVGLLIIAIGKLLLKKSQSKEKITIHNTIDSEEVRKELNK